MQPEPDGLQQPPTRVGELHSFERSVPLHMRCRLIYDMFVTDALMPGVVVVDSDGNLHGLMSRHRFLEVFSQSYRSEVYFNRPLKQLLRDEFVEPMCVPSDANITTVAESALRRSRDRFNEPLAIGFPDKVFKVLEMRDLLMALANIQTFQYTQLQVALDSLVRTEKLASLGAMVAGVAHEVNTPIGVSLSAASYLVDQADSFKAHVASQQIRKADLISFVQSSHEAGTIILRNMMRAADLVRNFKQVAVDQTSELRRQFELKQTINEILSNLGPNFKHSQVDLRQEVDDGINMDGYPGALGQVLTNLVVNSLIHGFSENESGTITVKAALSGRSQVVELRVHDNGRGIPADMQGRVFDPFFTTRRNQGGTGLGLHIVHNLVHNTLGGTIAMESHIGAGTTFLIRIPCSASTTTAPVDNN
jgi:signal transduction histidine kinase